MAPSLRYRVGALSGVVSLTAGAVLLANHPLPQSLLVSTPFTGQLQAITLSAGSLLLAVATVVVVAAVALAPLYRSRPRRMVDTIALTHRRVLLSTFALATIGYFDYTYRIPRTTLVITTVLMAVLLPAWFVAIRYGLKNGEERAIVVGDDVERFPRIRELAELPIVGYVSPSVVPRSGGGTRRMADGGERPNHDARATDGGHGIDDEVANDGGVADAGDAVTDHGRKEIDGGSTKTDGGSTVLVNPPDVELERLGGLSRLGDVLVELDPDVAILAFSRADRGEFFGALSTCHQHGVAAKVHRERTESVLTAGDRAETFIDVEIEPWDVQDHLLKRCFDVLFSFSVLVGLSPVVLAIAVAIKAEDGGPVLYRQRRTTTLGETFDVYKFRTMVEDAEDATGPVISAEDAGDVDPRVTRVGRLLRRSHLDEVPQLWSVLTGEMSVVGPRPERPELDSDIQTGVHEWRKRWFVKPGLTGLAQVNDVSSADPETKLRYDLEYIRRQSFWFDLRLVRHQIDEVLTSVAEMVADARER